MSESEKKIEENESSSDEEVPPGELDQPIVILYNKRAKKEIKRFESTTTKEKKAKTEKKEVIVSIPNGKGQALETMSEVVKNFAGESDRDLKVIFEVLFGHKKVKLNEVRKHIRKWNGWDVDPDSQEHHELQEGIGSMTTDNLKWAMDTLDISRRGCVKKEELVDKFCDWCMKPCAFATQPKKGSPQKNPKTQNKKNDEEKNQKKERKRKPEKDPNKPKRPQSAFLLYLNKNREAFNEEAGTKNPGTIGKLASEKWKELSENDKKQFNDEAEKLKAAYEIEMTKYNKENPTSPTKKAKTEKPEEKIEKKSEKSEKKKSDKSEKSKSSNEKSSSEKKSSEKPKKKKTENTVKSDKPMLALEKGKLISTGTKSETKKTKTNKNGTKTPDKKPEKSPKPDKTVKNKKPTEKKPKNIVIPNESQIEKFLIKLIQKANLEKLTMKQVLGKVGEKYPDLDVASKKSFIKAKVKELIQ